MDKIAIIGIAVIVGLVVLFFLAWSSINNKVNNAKTAEELRVACSNLTIQNAPVRCLELGKSELIIIEEGR